MPGLLATFILSSRFQNLYMGRLCSTAHKNTAILPHPYSAEGSSSMGSTHAPKKSQALTFLDLQGSQRHGDILTASNQGRADLGAGHSDERWDEN